MQTWVLYALLSMFSAGAVSVIGKMGLTGISSEVGLTVRTLFVSFFVLIFAGIFTQAKEYATLAWENYLWLGISGLATAFSWIFYYKALKIGNVANIALIDKGSVVVAMILAYLFLGEAISWRMAGGCSLIVCGLLVIAWR
ncbi:EamA family transporter [Acetobacteraceae bacterium]|nr:EamA family transporter [Acetobacteraceae bacterium]